MLIIFLNVARVESFATKCICMIYMVLRISIDYFSDSVKLFSFCDGGEVYFEVFLLISALKHYKNTWHKLWLNFADLPTKMCAIPVTFVLHIPLILSPLTSITLIFGEVNYVIRLTRFSFFMYFTV